MATNSFDTRPLDASTSADILHQAARGGVPVQLSAEDVRDGMVWRGSFARLSRETVHFSQVAKFVSLPCAWSTIPLRTLFSVENRSYSFVARRIDDMAAQSMGGITLSRPKVISLIERRREPRRRLQRGVSVRLDVGSEGDRLPAPPIEAMLLNLSPSGLACRMDPSSSVQLRCNDRIRIEFSLPSVRVPFAFNAIVVTKTRGSGDHHVIGLEFVVDPALHAREDDLHRGLSALNGAVCETQLVQEGA